MKLEEKVELDSEAELEVIHLKGGLVMEDL